MPKWLIAFEKEGKAQSREVEGNDEGQARIRFLNQADIQFQPVVLKKITPAGEDRSAAASVTRTTRRKVGQAADKDWRKRVDKLTDEIAALADKKQAAARKSDWSTVDKLQEDIRKKTIEREKLSKRNGPGALRA